MMPSLRDLAALSKDFRTFGIAGLGIVATESLTLAGPHFGVSDAAVSSAVTAIGVIVLGVAARGTVPATMEASKAKGVLPTRAEVTVDDTDPKVDAGAGAA